MATPSKSRHRGLQRSPRPDAALGTTDADEIPPSSISRITESVRKAPRPASFMKNNTCRNDKHALPIVAQTPTRGPTKLVGRSNSYSTSMSASNDRPRTLAKQGELKLPGADHASSLPYVLPPWPTRSQDTPSRGRSTDFNDGYRKLKIEATPSRAAPTGRNVPAATVLSSSQEKETSIYSSLGWDYDDVDELL